MHDVFKAVTLSFLIASLYLLFSATAAYAEIFVLHTGARFLVPEDRFRLALATASLAASLLCVWVLLATAFARKFISRLRPRTTLITALYVVGPIIFLNQILKLIVLPGIWSSIIMLVLSLLWASVGLHIILGYLTAASTTAGNDS